MSIFSFWEEFLSLLWHTFTSNGVSLLWKQKGIFLHLQCQQKKLKADLLEIFKTYDKNIIKKYFSDQECFYSRNKELVQPEGLDLMTEWKNAFFAIVWSCSQTIKHKITLLFPHILMLLLLKMDKNKYIWVILIIFWESKRRIISDLCKTIHSFS